MQPFARLSPEGKFNFAVLSLPSTTCPVCSGQFHVGGPLWNGKMHDANFLKNLIEEIKLSKELYATEPRMTGMMTVISEELEVPFFYSPSFMSNLVHCVTPSLVEFK
jgi:tRNA (guanine26-N2/guanine27-N2)-dimethyltransferase